MHPTRLRSAAPLLVSSTLVLASLAAPGALAEDDPAATNRITAEAGITERLILGFDTEAALVDQQWWEGQAEISDDDAFDATIARLVVAFQPIRDFEFGGRVGFGSTDTSGFLPDGSGATDLDLWGKYFLGVAGKDTSFAVGALATVPTGDDTAGLGNDAFSFGGFVSIRQPLDRATLSGAFGVRVHEDGTTLGVPLEGETSAFLRVGVLGPVRPNLTVFGEAQVESERFRRLDTDFRLLGGTNWKVTERGVVRGGIAIGLSDGAPDVQVIGGYAAQF